MSAVSNQQIYDLLLEISDDLADIEVKTDELLLNMRMFHQELETDRRQLAEARAHFAQERALLQ
jgi:predicted ATP-grasp superfamily ATP-dependent carboligase